MFFEFAWVILTVVLKLCIAHKQPNIIVILADDFGFNDVSFRGSDLIPTPNIDALAYSGRILNRHYVMPICTPSRSALLSGINPIQLGAQGYPLLGGQAGGVPLDIKLMPEYLKELGYSTHMTGKWHIGFGTSDYLPTNRGFDSFLGYDNGLISYYRLDANQTLPSGERFYGYDMHRDTEPSWDLQGQYATDIFTERAVDVILSHDKSQPLFLYVSHLAAHTGSEIGDGLEVPPGVNADEDFPYFDAPERRHYAAVVRALDDSVGKVVEALRKAEILNDSVILFMADNGGASVAADMPPNFASNWPLRGVKFTLYEGGVRGAALLWSNWFPGNLIDDQFLHITDWKDIFISMAGGYVQNRVARRLAKRFLNPDLETFPRNHLLNIDELYNTEGVIIDSRWKVVKQNMQKYANYDGHIGVQINNNNFSVITPEVVRNSVTGKILEEIGALPDDEKISSLRSEATEKCFAEITTSMGYVNDSTDFYCKEYCVFDIVEDPCELNPLNNNIILLKGIEIIEEYRKKLVPQNQNPVDPLSNPKYFGGVWTPWLDSTMTNYYNVHGHPVQLERLTIIQQPQSRSNLWDERE